MSTPGRRTADWYRGLAAVVPASSDHRLDEVARSAGALAVAEALACTNAADDSGLPAAAWCLANDTQRARSSPAMKRATAEALRRLKVRLELQPGRTPSSPHLPSTEYQVLLQRQLSAGIQLADEWKWDPAPWRQLAAELLAMVKEPDSDLVLARLLLSANPWRPSQEVAQRLEELLSGRTLR